MNTIGESLYPELIFTGLKARDRDDILRIMGGRLVELHFAKQSYPDDLIARENLYPTGMDVGGIGVAIPHTDTQSVQKTAFSIATLSPPVMFEDMGSEDGKISVQIVIVLCIAAQADYLSGLRRLVELIQDRPTLEGLLSASSPQEVISLIRKYEHTLQKDEK